MTAKTFKPEFTTRTGKRVSFGANYTHNTKAKRKAGRTKNGLPKYATPDGKIVEPRRSAVRALLVTSTPATVTLGVYFAISKLGPVVGAAAIVTFVWVAYKVVRWTAGEVAYFSVKARQIKGDSRPADDPEPKFTRVPSDTVEYPDDFAR